MVRKGRARRLRATDVENGEKARQLGTQCPELHPRLPSVRFGSQAYAVASISRGAQLLRGARPSSLIWKTMPLGARICAIDVSRRKRAPD